MNIIKRIRKSYFTKGLAITLAFNILGEIIVPTAAMALTSGPSQPEFQSFEPVETTDMVNLFTGDFTYNIPLMNVPGPNGGYPINLAYHANPSMDEEASWVGLGWSLNVGAINRQVRGLPDDFDGDTITTKLDMKENVTVGLGVTPSIEVFGAESGDFLNLGLNFRYNSYKGFGYSLNPSLGLMGDCMNYNVGLSLDPDDGVGVNARVSLPAKNKVGNDQQWYEVRNYFGVGFNSKSGLDFNSGRSVALKHYWKKDINEEYHARMVKKERGRFDIGPASYESKSVKMQVERTVKVDASSDFDYITTGIGVASSAGLSFSESSHNQSQSVPLNSYRLNVNIGLGSEFLGVFAKGSYSGNFDVQDLKYKGEDVSHQAYGYEQMYDNSQKKNVINDFSRSKGGDVRKTTPNLATPQLTHDVYGILGQGIGGSFRPYRTETGRIYDPLEVSTIGGGYFNLDFSTDTKKVGWGTGATIGYSEQQAWDNHHVLDNLAYTQPLPLWRQAGVVAPTFQKEEKVLYKIAGEKATLHKNELDHIGGERPIGGKITSNGVVSNYGVELDENEDDPDVRPDITNQRNINSRIARNNLVNNTKNSEILGYHPDFTELSRGYAQTHDDHSFLGEYEIFYYEWGSMNQATDPTKHLDRETRNGSSIKHHNGGYKVLDNTGANYVYGLPVYNTKEIEKVFTINSTLDNGDGTSMPIYENKHAIVPFETEVIEGVTDVVYKHPNTQKLYSKKETPAYATSYLLTSILGADYIDLDGNGPDEGDQGYWVKMDYVKYTDNYKWRAPYKGVMYSSGSEATLEDDVASYQYGEKEIWYLSRIETETHIAIFVMEEDRSDNYEAIHEFANLDDEISTATMKSGLRLSQIKLYEKRAFEDDAVNAIPIQTVQFNNSHKLCKNAQNHADTRGKLTLNGLYMTYGDNAKGAMNPYVFNYSENNPDYSFERYDRWGNYKGEPSTNLDLVTDEINQELPYTGQYQQGAWGYNPDGSLILLDDSKQNLFQNQQNDNVSAWSLSEITLPSGGKITVDYEADDYAYVQNHQATQMSYITGVNDNTTNRNELYQWNGSEEPNDFADPTQRRIYFKLEEPIRTDFGSEEALSNLIYDKYVDGIRMDEGGNRNLYFKTFAQLKGVAWDYVSGYVPLEPNELQNWEKRAGGAGTPAYTYGASNPETIDGFTHYTEGFVTISASHKKNDPEKAIYRDFHPMALAAWQYLRINVPQILQDGGDFNTNDIANTDKAKARKVKNLLGFIPELAKMAVGYRRFCYQREMSRYILLNKSMIRLTSPDRKKFGGGSRVKQITLSDNWNDFENTEESEEYGVVYDYTTTDSETGEIYSSGVAQYEPMIGGDEIAMRYPKFYPGKIPFFSDNNLFFEHPINESYMPAPTVGYSRVVVRSLNTANQMQIAEYGAFDAEEKKSVTGAQVYEFYTARDYPVIVEETPMGTENNTIKSFNVPIIIPFVAEYRRNKIAATQGYKIELNDMHGKLKSTSSYGLDNNYALLAEPLTRTSYLYRSETAPVTSSSEDVKGLRLDNFALTLKKDPITGGYAEDTKYIGVDYEFFTDQRHNKHAVLSVGLDFNIDIVMIPFVGPITIPSCWGHLRSSKNDVRTFTTNKIIRKSGLLSEVITENENYVSSVKTLMYDDISGRPLLTYANDEYKEPIYNLNHPAYWEYEEPIYNLNHPAYWEYEGMGHAYQNINLEFYAELDKISTKELFGGTVPSEIIDDLVPGDEFIAHIRPLGSELLYQNYRATFISKNYNGGPTDVIIHIANVIPKETGASSSFDAGVEGYFKVYRSGYRNHYMTDAGSITSKVNPVDPSNISSITKTYHAITGEEILPSSESITMNVRQLSEKVLSSGATTFKDNWEVEKGSNENPYQVGQAGIWRPTKSYVYAGDRSQTSADGIKSPQVKNDGFMTNVPFFNWQVTDYERFQENWQWSGEVTRLNKFGYETENKDRLGIYSAALYGYRHALPIGVGGNATYAELATQDFEMFNPSLDGAALMTEAKDLEAESNFYFHTNTIATGSRSVAHSDKFKIVGGKVGAENFIYIEGEHDASYWSDVNYIDLAVQSSNTSGKQDYRVLRANVTAASTTTVPGCLVCPYTKVTLEFEHETILPTESAQYLRNSTHVGGMATVYRNISVDGLNKAPSTNLTIVPVAHTGKQSLKVENGYAGFIHGKLQLIPGKRYVVSYWAKRDNANVFDYNLESTLQIYVAGTTDNLIISSETKTSNVINGWQKIDVEFEIDPEIYIQNQAIETRFTPNAVPLYIDDVRLCPKTGGIMTYVYHTDNYKLAATLNGNNYATFYYYSDQGNLYLVKQETEKGIITSGGSRGHMREYSVE